MEVEVSPTGDAGRDGDVCAVGDMHGDIDHGLRALMLCGAVDTSWRWVGGTMTVVQTGDVTDRGNSSLALLHRLWDLRAQGPATIARRASHRA